MAKKITSESKCITNHSIAIYDRGGRRRVNEFTDVQTVKWERTRDGISEASIKLTRASCLAQQSLISNLMTHRHEMVVFRGGDRVWEGPLHRIGWKADGLEVTAKDVLSYVFATPLTKKWSSRHPNVEATTARIGRIIRHELATNRVEKSSQGVSVPIMAWEKLDPPINVLPYLTVHSNVNEARTSTETDPFQMTVGEHLASLARTAGIDYTAVGRAIHIWDVSRNIGELQPLVSSDFLAEVLVTEYGADHAQLGYVSSQEGVYGGAVTRENLELYGPWTSIYTPYNQEGTIAQSKADLESQARRNLNGRSPAPREVRIPDGSSVVLSERLKITDLVPGVAVPLRAELNGQEMVQMQKIDHVTVTETASGENIQVTLTPATRPDSDEVE